METYKITPIDLERQKPTKIGNCFIELHPDRLRYVMDFWAEEPTTEDEKLGPWENVRIYFEVFYFKRCIVGLEKSITVNKKWCVLLTIAGVSHDLKTYFRTEIAADQLFNFIKKWLLD
jgi:hypothetical protein